MNLFLPLETEHLHLRPLTLDDANFVFQHFSDPAVTHYLLDEPPLTDYEQAKALIEFYLEPEHESYNRWGIVLKAASRLIGTCGFRRWDRRNFRAEIGYDLGQAYWGQGIMTEALRAAIRFGFEQMELNRIEAVIYVENSRSIRLLQRLGFRQEGLLRNYHYLNSQFYDHWLFSLLKREWRGRE